MKKSITLIFLVMALSVSAASVRTLQLRTGDYLPYGEEVSVTLPEGGWWLLQVGIYLRG